MGIEIIFKIAIVGVISAISNQLLKSAGKDDIATLITLATVVIVLFMLVGMIGELFDKVKSLFSLY
ncbi:MAG: stage III sporulation protein AC [Clostridia bacterium]|nr:stage III sporulation protein AC [Clostridia bacterium]MBR4745715.1 stage III sporulation protein AC [Clostridia bacterium]